jgi:transposase
MAYRVGCRNQQQLLPSSIEEFVGPEDPVRAYDSFVECLDLEALGFRIDPDQVGRPQFDPCAMLKLLVYGYAYGIRSSRKLERATHHNLSFMWLMGGLQPDHKTIARFRREHTDALAQVLRQCAQVCQRLGLIEGNTLFVDGTKIRANASNKHTWTVKRCREHLAQIDERIESMLRECEQADLTEDADAARFPLPQRLQNERVLRTRIEGILEQLGATERTGINTTDQDAGRMRMGAQVEPGYNCQAVVDDRHGLIVHTEVSDAANDAGQLGPQITRAELTLGKRCETACADAGYSSPEDLGKILERGTEVVVPIVQRSDFRDHFRFDAQLNQYVCPEGHRLSYFGENRTNRSYIYGVRNANTCLSCSRFGHCTRSQQGRRVERPFTEAIRERLDQLSRRPSGRVMMHRRKLRAEHPFGHLKHNLGMRTFLLRGRGGARAEMALGAAAFNITRMTKILGVLNLMEALIPA